MCEKFEAAKNFGQSRHGGEDGFVFEVMGFMLTGSQILKLCEYGQLSAEGISAFSKSVEGGPMARKAVPQRKS